MGLAHIADAAPSNPNSGFLTDATTKGSSATPGAPLGTATAVGIAVGASALTALMAAGVALLTSSKLFSAPKSAPALLSDEGKPAEEGEAHEGGAGRRRKERAAVAPAQ